MSSIVQKATPFFEHIVIGIAFVVMGYIFFWTFHTSLISIIGMAAICFGSLKILIGIITYGAWMFAVLFRRDYLKKKELEEEQINTKPKKKEEGESGEKPPAGWFRTNAPFVAKYWSTILELGILLAGFLIIVITRTGL